MTANADYSYLNLVLPFDKADLESMIRAVRIKLGAKDKIVRNYNPAAKVNSVVAEPAEKESLIDTSEENLEKLQLKLDAMISQEKVPYVQKHAVLFTKALVEKIEKVNSKWFSKEDMKETSNEEVNVGVENMAIPNTWENVETTELENNLQNEAQAEISKLEASNTNDNESETFSNVLVEPVEIKQAEVAEPVSAETTTLKNNTETAALPATNIEENTSSFDFTLPSFELKNNENQPANVEQKLPVSTENSNIPSFEFNANAEIPNVEIPEPAEIKAEPATVETNAAMSIEDKIASLLNRENNVTTMENKNEEAKIPSQADVLARIQKTKNALKDKDAEITALKNKVDELNDRYMSTRAKLEGYNAVIRDVTAKYDTAARSSDEISSKYEQLEETLTARIKTLEEQLKESQQARVVESEKSKQTIADLKSSHAKEMEELNRTNNLKVQNIRDEKDKQLKEAYSSILDVLSPSEETYKKVA